MHHKNTDIETSLQSDTIHFYGTQPQHFGDYDGANIHHQEHNRLCGDDITVHIQLRDGIIERWTFTGHASMITIACS